MIGFPLTQLYLRIRTILPTSPHSLFDEKKNYKQLKSKIDEIFDAETDVISASKKLDSAFIPMGMNYHFFNYVAPIYGELSKALKAFEKALKTTTPEIKEYYSKLSLPSSAEVYQMMKEDFENLKERVEETLDVAKRNSPDWEAWDPLEIRWDKVNELFKRATKDK